jgi:hypothetical protein
MPIPLRFGLHFKAGVMSNISASITTNYIATILAYEAVLVPFPRCIIVLYRIILLRIWNLLIRTFRTSLVCTKLSTCFRILFWLRFLRISIVIAADFYTAFFTRIWLWLGWLKILYISFFLLLLLFLSGSLWLKFRLFRITFFRLTHWELRIRLLQNF